MTIDSYFCQRTPIFISPSCLILATRSHYLQARSFKPDPFFPTSQTPQTVQTVPLYFAWYLLPSNEHVSNPDPVYMGVSEAAQTSNSAN
jgi:hypothetical protein